jgi:hypothetical protein
MLSILSLQMAKNSILRATPIYCAGERHHRARNEIVDQVLFQAATDLLGQSIPDGHAMPPVGKPCPECVRSLSDDLQRAFNRFSEA